MSDFNKGDFTQQGVDGHVRATLRLNEKRYVELDLTTNENVRGCTISGNVHDRLNNLDYPIGAGVSGNIEITENGENINVAQYATATVNVESGVPVDNLLVTLLDNASFTAAESMGEIAAEVNLPLCRALPTGSNKTVQVKLDDNNYVEYPVTLSTITGDFTIGEPENTPIEITGNISRGLCHIYINDTNTHTITVRFRATGIPTYFDCDGGSIISLRTLDYLFIMDCQEISPGHSTLKTYPIPLSAGANNRPQLYSWSSSGEPK